MLYSPRDKLMSSLPAYVPNFTVSNLLHLVGIFLVALILNHLLRLITNLIIKPASLLGWFTAPETKWCGP
jgi:hypothetical protein